MDQLLTPRLPASRLSGKTPVPNTGTTPVPNALLDRVMPTLRDTELRLLLVVVRQTRGWQDAPGSPRRKQRDWLTQSQLMARTGRGSGAVSQAVEALVQAGLIEVQDRAGRPLRTAGERRRHLGRLYYRLGAAAGKQLGAAATQVAQEPAPLEAVAEISPGMWKSSSCLWKTGTGACGQVGVSWGKGSGKENTQKRIQQKKPETKLTRAE